MLELSLSKRKNVEVEVTLSSMDPYTQPVECKVIDAIQLVRQLDGKTHAVSGSFSSTLNSFNLFHGQTCCPD